MSLLYSVLADLARFLAHLNSHLLLTIIALVHRLDAALPDQRVVLYQKCTETLLKTWHTQKFREIEAKSKGRVDRRNKRRIETIAYWFHQKGGETNNAGRSIVPYNDLKIFLAKHISTVEKSQDPDNDPEDLADEFLSFIKTKAGLMVEVGDNFYSFVHLTFQEFLASAYILVEGQNEGVPGIWQIIGKHCRDPRWHEVVRLTIAGIENNEGQRRLIELLIKEEKIDQNVVLSRLLGGILLDGIDSAEVHEEYKEDIITTLLRSCSTVTEIEQLRLVISPLRTLSTKKAVGENIIYTELKKLWENTENNEKKLRLALVAIALGSSYNNILHLIHDIKNSSQQINFLKLIFLSESNDHIYSLHSEKIENLWSMLNILSLESTTGNTLAAAGLAVFGSSENCILLKKAFQALLLVFFPYYAGPCHDYIYNILRIISDLPSETVLDELCPILAWVKNNPLESKKVTQITNFLKRLEPLKTMMEKDPNQEELIAKLKISKKVELDKKRMLSRTIDTDIRITRKRKKEVFWQSVILSPEFANFLISTLCVTLNLEPNAQWSEALHLSFLPQIPERISLFYKLLWKRVEHIFENGEAGEVEIHIAAWQLLFDSWLYLVEYYHDPNESLFAHLADITSTLDNFPLRIAHFIRNTAYGNIPTTKEIETLIETLDEEDKLFMAEIFLPLDRSEKLGSALSASRIKADTPIVSDSDT
jgi:hypothetical protein